MAHVSETELKNKSDAVIGIIWKIGATVAALILIMWGAGVFGSSDDSLDTGAETSTASKPKPPTRFPEDQIYEIRQSGGPGAEIRPERFTAYITRYAPQDFLAVKMEYCYDSDGVNGGEPYAIRFHSDSYEYDPHYDREVFAGEFSQPTSNRTGKWVLWEVPESTRHRPRFEGWVEVTRGEPGARYHMRLFPASGPASPC